MRKLFSSLLMLPVMVWAMIGCDSDYIAYSGPDYVGFSDSVALMPVFTQDSVFGVYVASTKTYDYDRTFAVEVLENKSNAVEGLHYQMVNHNVVIKAGERAGMVTMKGIYENIRPDDNLYIRLRLAVDPALTLDLYSNEMSVELVKCYPFDIEAFTGNIRMYATFPFSNDEIKTFVLKSERKDAKTLILKEPFTHNYDITLKFDDSDPMTPLVNIPSQIGFVDGTYGTVYVRSVETDPCYFSIPDRMLMLHMEFYLPKVGSFGVHRVAIQWITQEEADYENNDII